MDDIPSSQRSHAIKTGVGFHESIEDESSSENKTRNANAMLNKEMKGHPHQQPRKEILQRKSFAPNRGSDRGLFPTMNNVECYECHNLGHVAAKYINRMVQDYHTERSSHSRYFKGYCFACNMFGHKAIDCNKRNMKHVRCYACNKLGHIAKDCRKKVRISHQKEKSSSHLKIWKKKEVQSERCSTAQSTQMQHSTDITNSGGA